MSRLTDRSVAAVNKGGIFGGVRETPSYCILERLYDLRGNSWKTIGTKGVLKQSKVGENDCEGGGWDMSL
jgi:hypothetical protein